MGIKLGGFVGLTFFQLEYGPLRWVSPSGFTSPGPPCLW